jgi:hypothetical protein
VDENLELYKLLERGVMSSFQKNLNPSTSEGVKVFDKGYVLGDVDVIGKIFYLNTVIRDMKARILKIKNLVRVHTKVDCLGGRYWERVYCEVLGIFK